MEQNSTSVRLKGLDGIRGIAILLVVLNHVDATYISKFLPSQLNQIIFGSGITGVSLLFLLSGFLMQYIYPNPANGLHFLQKRYTRIFPLFLTLSICMLIFRIYPGIYWLWQIGIILGLALVAHFIWVGVVKKLGAVFKKRIFIFFLITQFLVGGVYLFYFLRQPPIVFWQMPAFASEGMVWLINATLTLPLGNYVPMLDGVYWSLVAEVFFYILYPFICIPLIRYVSAFGRFAKIVFVLSLVPFFVGLDILSKRVMVLSMLQLPLCFYFAVGMMTGYFFKKRPEVVLSIDGFFPGFLKKWVFVLFLCLIFGKLFVLKSVYASFYGLVHILWAFPLAFFVAIALNGSTSFAKILNSRFLLFLGMISYSVYLCHTAIVHMVERSIGVSDVTSNLYALVAEGVLTVAIGFVLYVLLEKPYFKKSPVRESAAEYRQTVFGRVLLRPKIIMGALVLVLAIFIVNAYQSRLNFFSMEKRYKNDVFVERGYIENDEVLLNKHDRVSLKIKPDEDNFEMLTVRIWALASGTPGKLVFRIKEAGSSEWIAVNDYDLAKMGGDSDMPFGFPLIVNSKGKTYIAEFELSNKLDRIIIRANNDSIAGVYKIDKGSIFRNPSMLVKLFAEKIGNVFVNQEARLVTELFLPLLLIFAVTAIPRSKIFAIRYNNK